MSVSVLPFPGHYSRSPPRGRRIGVTQARWMLHLDASSIRRRCIIILRVIYILGNSTNSPGNCPRRVLKPSASAGARVACACACACIGCRHSPKSGHAREIQHIIDMNIVHVHLSPCDWSTRAVASPQPNIRDLVPSQGQCCRFPAADGPSI